MVYLTKIVDFVNTVLQDGLKAYPTADYKGIAVSTVIQRQNSSIVFPSVIDGEGYAKGVYFQSGVPFVLYHRLTATTFSMGQNQRFGDGALRKVDSLTSVQIIVMGTRDRLNISPEQLGMHIADTLPSSVVAPELQQLGVASLDIIEAGIDYDQRAVFNKEFQGIKYFIGPELFMLAVRYTIQGTYLKGCTSKCDC